jgi:catechol-2,3-dioxygenase
VRGLGETVLRVKDLARMKAFYSRIIGLELMKEFDGIARVVSLALDLRRRSRAEHRRARLLRPIGGVSVR